MVYGALVTISAAENRRYLLQLGHCVHRMRRAAKNIHELCVRKFTIMQAAHEHSMNGPLTHEWTINLYIEVRFIGRALVVAGRTLGSLPQSMQERVISRYSAISRQLARPPIAIRHGLTRAP